MQALVCEDWRAWTKLGMAMAASSPMMATTIMISTKVKPALREGFFILALSFFFCGVNEQQAGYLLFRISFTYCLLQPHVSLLKQAECQDHKDPEPRRRFLAVGSRSEE